MMLVFFVILSGILLILSVFLLIKISKNALGLFILALFLCGIIYMFIPNAQQDAYDIAYKTCHDKWNANDTMRNTAILIVQIQFKKLDQLSLAPSDSFGAINIICEIDANKAKDAVKSKEKSDDFMLKLFPNTNK